MKRKFNYVVGTNINTADYGVLLLLCYKAFDFPLSEIKMLYGFVRKHYCDFHFFYSVCVLRASVWAFGGSINMLVQPNLLKRAILYFYIL